ncbi:glycine--tRNA ligase subunit beta [Lentilactobacillus senioris]|nr:glycine--tRNA ligase subunit beta [Lentilactobacillus senioris]
MANNFLLEIGLEDMPAHVVTPSVEQLKKRVATYLKDQRITFANIEMFATPRRLAVIVKDLADKQPDIDEEVKGPAKKIALDADGNWTKAAIGFSKGQGASVDDIVFKELKGVDYVYVQKHIQGQPVQEVLAGLKDVITAMTFPTLMKWGANSLNYIRPIKWLVALYNEEVIPFSILDITTDKVSEGHRFLGHEAVINTPLEYEEKLTEQFVIASLSKRKQMIKDQIAAIAQNNNWQVHIDPELLEEVTNLVEWPTAFAGGFDPKYLVIPDEVLITSMRDHQRFFYVQDSEGKLLPNFISVRNGNDHMINNVIAGNEKVLTARLEDAMFFFEEDQKVNVADYVERLKKVSFHDKISTMYEKMQRVGVIANHIANAISLPDAARADLTRASEIYKFDLVSGMVGEFAELQGVMGEKYALLQGENSAVATAIREHYMPISANGELPTSTIGAILAVADKLDSVMTFFAAGMIPSGSNDPYALRRQASGIVRIITDQDWSLNLNDVLVGVEKEEQAAGVAPAIDLASQNEAVIDFIKDRVRQYLGDLKVRYDITDAVINGLENNILFIVKSAQVLTNHKDDADFKNVVESLTRVLRIADKAESLVTVDPALFENESETKLYEAVSELTKTIAGLTADQLYTKLVAISPIISEYFDATMVMAKDEAIKNNRLSQLHELAQMIYHLGDLNQLVVKS